MKDKLNDRVRTRKDTGLTLHQGMTPDEIDRKMLQALFDARAELGIDKQCWTDDSSDDSSV